MVKVNIPTSFVQSAWTIMCVVSSDGVLSTSPSYVIFVKVDVNLDDYIGIFTFLFHLYTITLLNKMLTRIIPFACNFCCIQI